MGERKQTHSVKDIIVIDVQEARARTAERAERSFNLIKEGYQIVLTRWQKRGMLTNIRGHPAVYMGSQAPKPNLKLKLDFGLIVLKSFEQLDKLQKFINAIRYRDWKLVDVKREGTRITLTKVRKAEKEAYEKPTWMLRLDLDDEGAMIWDSSLRKHVYVHFKPNGIYCRECWRNSCKHIHWLLAQAGVNEIIQKKK